MELIARILGRSCIFGGSEQTKQHGEQLQRHTTAIAAAQDASSAAKDFVAEVLSKSGGGAAAAACAAAGAATDSASLSSGIPAAYNSTSGSKHAADSQRRSTDASTSYPTMSYGDDWDALGACMTTAMEMEASVDAVVSSAACGALTSTRRHSTMHSWYIHVTPTW
eukprot:GHRQ01012381.1.p2 GENE.GHRQ01012381.1~~GHRQ01012381.1.p2  ORF type:complete len:166 (+),score=54.81 GHRQ01012381.1:852-1349(+)